MKRTLLAIIAGLACLAIAAQSNIYPIPGIEVKPTRCYHDGMGAVVVFTMTNSSPNAYSIVFNGTDGLDEWAKCRAIGGDNAPRACYVKSFGDDNAMDMVTRSELAPGETKMGVLRLNNLAREVKSINSFSIAGLWQIKDSNDNHNFSYNVESPIPVFTPQNTTQEAVYCTLPSMFVTLKSIERKGANVWVNLELKNAGKTPLKLKPTSGYVKDINGNDNYQFGMALDGKELNNYTSFTFEPGKPVNGIFCIINVPATVKSFDDIIWCLEGREYFISLRGKSITKP